jgi:hypothetical protein
MKWITFFMRHLSLLLILVSCERYQLPDSHNKFWKKEMFEILPGIWKLEKLYVNGIDTTDYLNSITNGGLKLYIDKDDTQIKDRIYADFRFLFTDRDSIHLNALVALDKIRGLPVFYHVLAGPHIQYHYPLIRTLGPSSSYTRNDENNFSIIRYLDKTKISIIDYDQYDQEGKSISNLFEFRKL